MMTEYQFAVCKANFLASMEASGYGSRLEETEHGIFARPDIHLEWLGFLRCWEQHVQKHIDEKFDQDTTEQTNEVECVFVGGPLHGIHMQNTSKEFRVVEHNDKEYLYTRCHVNDDTNDRVIYLMMNRSPQTTG